jgi:ABC-type ATPase involved in cell division
MLALEIRALPRRVMRDRAADILAAVGLAWKLEARPRTLSAGEQQRVAIARALVGEPAILLCDEPTGNLDPALTRDILQLLCDVHRRGTTILLATHDLQIMELGERAGLPRARILAGRLAAWSAGDEAAYEDVQITHAPLDGGRVLAFPHNAGRRSS